MLRLRRIAKPVTYSLLLGFLTLTLHVPATQAALVGTDAVVSSTEAQDARDQLRATLQRDDVKQQLIARGVSAEQVQARVDNLTDAEAIQLAAHMDEMPAGGISTLGAVALVFLILVITDMLGYTDVFPFVDKAK